MPEATLPEATSTEATSTKAAIDRSGREVLIGKVVGVFGIRGELKIASHTEPVAAILNYQPWTLRLGQSDTVIDNVKGRANAHGVVAKFPDLDDRNDAEKLIGAEVWVPRSVLRQTKPGDYYWVDLEGLRVRTTDGVDLGVVSHLLATGANDVLVVQGERERLIPFVLDHYVMAVDLDAGTMTVDWDPEF